MIRSYETHCLGKAVKTLKLDLVVQQCTVRPVVHRERKQQMFGVAGSSSSLLGFVWRLP